MERYLGMPEAASAHAADLDYMMGLLHWLILALFVGWAVYFIFVLFRFRRSRQPKASYTGTKTKFSTYVEGGVVLAEAVLLIGFSIPLWSQRVAQFPDERESVVVRVLGEQFVWNAHYPGPDGVFGRTAPELMDSVTNPVGLDRSDPNAGDDIVTVNQLHLPVDQPALIHLSSKDVIHSFALKEMRIKQDTVPGLSIPVWFVPTVTTEEMRARKGQDGYNYEISCAQLCGIGHYRMRGFMTIHTQEGFQQWLTDREFDEEESDADFWGQ